MLYALLTSLYALTICETISFSGGFPVCFHLSNASTISLLSNDLFSMLALSFLLLSTMLLPLHNVLKLQMSSFKRCRRTSKQRRGSMMNGDGYLSLSVHKLTFNLHQSPVDAFATQFCIPRARCIFQ